MKHLMNKDKKKNTISLINNIMNDCINKIHLLNEKEYNLDHILLKLPENYRKKVKQHVIEKRMTFNDGMGFANTFCKNKIIIIANLDIFFTPELDICKKYDFTNLFCSLSRYELLNDYNFDGNNKIAKFIHNGQLGNPCIDSHDAWMFKTPIKMTPKSKIMLGSEGCDTIINYVYGEIMKYNVVNPIDSIITIHYHRERERDYRTQNRVRSHSGLEYNKDNSFTPDDYQHKYILQKEIIVCNQIQSFCTFATKGAYKDLRLLLHSLELYHEDIPIFILCDKWINDKIDSDGYNLKIHKQIELEKYTDMNRKIMEEKNLFTEFLLKKADVIDYAMEFYENTLFIDGDIVILNKLDLLIDRQYDVGLSPHHILEESEKIFGKYNAGLMFIANKNITNNWRHLVKTRGGFVDQQSLDYFEEDFKVFKFDDSYNYGWWRLFQCKNPQERLNLFSIDDTIYYEFNTLKCIHTHLYEKNDQQTIQFNKLILQMLEKINHPILKYINQSEEEIMKEKKVNNKKIVAFTQTYGEERWSEIVLQKYDKIGQYMRNKCDKIIYSFHNCSKETRQKGREYMSKIYDKNKLIFFEYNDMDYLTSIRKTMKYLKENGFTDILFMNDDEYFINNKSNLENLKNLDEIWKYYCETNIKWFSLYGKEIPQNKNIKKQIKKDKLDIYCYSTLEYKKDNAYAWSQTTALYNIDFCVDLYNNKLPDDSWNIEETFSYFFHTNDFDRWGCNMELVRAINLHGHNLAKENLYDNIKRFFENNNNIKELQKIYDIIYSIENNILIEEIEENEEEKSIPKIIIPKLPRNDFWNHSGDTFRELVSLWKEKGYCEVIETDNKHIWLNNIGDILLYDRPTLDWLAQDTDIRCNKILFGNPVVPENLKNNASNWIFWGRSPRKLEKFYNMTYKKFNERKLKSIFIGKIENQIQLNYRNIDFSKYIQLYVMHKPNEKYKYNQDEYLDLLKHSKFGLCLRGFGPKCNREIELMALGTIPIVEKNVDMDNYYDPPQENIHYLRFSSPEEIQNLIDNCSEDKWTKMSLALS